MPLMVRDLEACENLSLFSGAAKSVCTPTMRIGGCIAARPWIKKLRATLVLPRGFFNA
jgi:hypothetical protein